MVYQSLPTLPEKIARQIALMQASAIKVANQSDLISAIDKSGLNYTVEAAERLNPRRNDERTGRYEIFRTDSGHMLGADRTKRYTITQNAKALEIIYAFASTQKDPVYLSNAHVFDNGSSWSVSVDFGFALIGDPKKGDVIMQRMTISGAHDGSGATRIAITPFRVKCLNGACGWDSATTSHVVRHTKTADARIDEINLAMNGVRRSMAKTEAVFQALATAQMTRAQFIKSMDLVYPVEGKEKQAAKNAQESRERAIANYESADGGFIDRETGWNGFNSYTHITTHESNVRIHDENRTPEQAMALSKLSGAASKLDQKALSGVVKVLKMEDDIARILRRVETSQVANLALYAPQPVTIGALSIWDLEVGL